MRIIYITQTFPPEPGATVRPLKQAVELSRLGHEVTIITSIPCFPMGNIHPAYRNRTYVKESVSNIDVVRVWSYPAANRGLLRRLLNLATFAISSTIAAHMLNRADVVIASVPHLGTELAGLAVASLKRCNSVLELRDLLPDNLAFIDMWQNSTLVRFIATYFKRIYSRYDWIAIPNKAMVVELERRGVDTSKLLLLRHGTDCTPVSEFGQPQLRKELKLEDLFVVFYAGSFATYYRVPDLVQAMRHLPKTRPPIHLCLLGTGPDHEKVRTKIRELKLSNVTLLDPVPPDDVRPYLMLADLFIAPMCVSRLPPSYHNYITTKVCEYMSLGRPIISVGPADLLGNLLLHIGAGSGVPEGDPEALAERMVWYVEHPDKAKSCGLAARKFALDNLERRAIVDRFVADLQVRMQYRFNHVQQRTPKETDLLVKINSRNKKLRLASPSSSHNGWKGRGRWLESAIAVMCLGFLAVPIGLLSFLILLVDGRPIFFSHERIGRHGVPFRLIKFRTMSNNGCHQNAITVGRDARITNLGGWLRKYHVDELPQLVNILCGEMSFIGPRPELAEFVNFDNPAQCDVLSVRPGLVDRATLMWLNEAELLAEQKDWYTYYTKVVLPDKIARSVQDIRSRSIANDRELLRQVARRLFRS